MASVAEEMVRIADAEWRFFGCMIEDKEGNVNNTGYRETDFGYWQRVGHYWHVGVGLDYTGLNTDKYWSAAFVSYVMKVAGAGAKFNYSARHSDYINKAIDDCLGNNRNAGFWGRSLEERAPAIGDLVCYAREEGIGFSSRPEKYASHADIVVAVNPGEIEVIGGNVHDSVTKKILAADEYGRLSDPRKKWFTVLQNRL
ncbi:MAG: DUF2272 domain-containing protein [Candidatus Hydrogenedentes bacterium]|nr:DUF2272 domain-containing protein [Candidatus Hydrogenedentota bacterium]